MSILIAFLIVFAAGILILFVRAEICKIKGRTLAKKKPVCSEPISGKLSDEFSEKILKESFKKSFKEYPKGSFEDLQVYYSKRLAEMISCQTVSKKGKFHPEEFYKLRSVIRELFPEVTKKAEIRYFGEDCYLYKFEGKDLKKNVMLMSHHDVVPAEGEWNYPPFSGEIAEGCIWGRGTVDTKTPLFAEFSALEELLKEGWIPPCNVYLVSSHNEEIAGDGAPLVLQWLKEQKITFEWILDEGGAVIDAPMSGIDCKCAMLAVHEKGRCSIRVKAAQAVGHGSLVKQLKSPAVRIAGLITYIEKKQPFLRKIHPEVLAMFESLAPYMKLPMRLVFANMWCFGGILKRLIPALNAQAGSMLGTTCTFKNLQSAENGDCTAEVLFRCVKEEDLRTDLETFQKIAEKFQVEVDEVIENECYRPASMESNGYRFIKSCVEEVFDYAACAPFILPAGTDARHFSELSDAVIRFAPIDINNQQYTSVHDKNENIGIESVVRAVVFYKAVLRKL